MPQYVKSSRISLADHPGFNERWVQEQIIADPSILGLGEVTVRASERRQARAGRLDLLLQETDGAQRYVVELQLGATDESHLVRTLEYWDLERRRYPSFEHIAVIVAEDVTTRFLNVISLFNGSVPVVAIQMVALQVGEAMTLTFTKVLDAVRREPDEEEVVTDVVDKAYWINRASAKTVAEGEQVEELVRQFDDNLRLRYNKHYVGFARDGIAYNFAVLRPRKTATNLDIRLPRSEDVEARLEQAGLELQDYDARWGAIRIRLALGDVQKHAESLVEVLKTAYEARGA
jgi:hypothetical protein